MKLLRTFSVKGVLLSIAPVGNGSHTCCGRCEEPHWGANNRLGACGTQARCRSLAGRAYIIDLGKPHPNDSLMALVWDRDK